MQTTDTANVRTVTIMYRGTYDGGSGWRYYPVKATIAATCPVCGGPRGEPVMRRFCEDGEWFDLDTWENPCGHIDLYRDVYAEAKQTQEKRNA
jgi:hypothetical protein